MDPIPITAQRADRPEHTPETELVVVEHDGDDVLLRLDDGIELRFDRGELRAAISHDRVDLVHRQAA